MWKYRIVLALIATFAISTVLWAPSASALEKPRTFSLLEVIRGEPTPLGDFSFDFREWRSSYPASTSFEFREVRGRDDLWVAEISVRYDQGSSNFGISILELSGDRIARETIYVTEGWEPPEWRAQWKGSHLKLRFGAWSLEPRYAAFFVASLPVPLHSGHSSTMRSSYIGPGT